MPKELFNLQAFQLEGITKTKCPIQVEAMPEQSLLFWHLPMETLLLSPAMIHHIELI